MVLAPAVAAPAVAALIAVVACGFDGEGGRDGATMPGATTFDAGAAADGPDPSADGAVVDAGDPDGTTQLLLDDGGGDGGLDAAACTPVPLDAFGSAGWALLGSAMVNGSQVQLTPLNSGGSAGALWWKTPLTFSGSLHVVLDFTFALGTTAGDGITVAWIPTTKTYAVGPEGQSYGICNAGLAGSAVAVDTRDNQFVVVSPISNCNTNGVITVSTVPTSKKVTVDIRATGIKATLDTGVAIGRAVTSPTTGYLGFTAATGNGFTSHTVTGVSASLCP
jgi:hypothetical protein